MKNYRKVVADAYAMRELLEYLASRADDLLADAKRCHERMKDECKDGCDEYYASEIVEYEAKAAAFERLLERLGK